MAPRTPSGTPAITVAQARGIDFEVHAYEHDPASASYGWEAAEALGVDPGRVFKTLIADVDGRAVVAIVPVTEMLDLRALASACGAKRARMLDPAKAQRLTGYVVGGISPLGQKSALPTVLDASALGHRTIYISAGRRGLDMELSPSDLQAITAATTAPIATSTSDGAR